MAAIRRQPAARLTRDWRAPTIATVHAESAYLFRHALLRDAAYQLQLPGDRARLHALAIAAIESVLGQSGNIESLAHCAAELAEHARAASYGAQISSDDLERREWTYCRLAADWALRHFEFKSAAAHFCRVSELASVPPKEAAEVQQSAAEALRNAGELRQAQICIDKSVDLANACGATEVAFKSRVFRASLLRNTGERVKAVLEYQSLLDEAPAGLRYFALVGLGKLETESGNPVRASELLREALDSIAPSQDDFLSTTIRSNLATAMAQMGRWPEAESLFRSTLGEFRNSGRQFHVGVTLSNIAQIEKHQGRLSEAQQDYLASIRLLIATGNRRHLARTLANYGNLLADLNQRVEARACLIESLAGAREMAESMLELNVMGNLAMMDIDDGFLLRGLAGLNACCAGLAPLGRSDIGGTFLSELGKFKVLVHGPDAGESSLAQAALHARSANVRLERYLPARHIMELARAAEGNEGALAEAERTLNEMAQLAHELRVSPENLGATALASARARQEVAERAVATNRSPILFRGWRPEELTSLCRAALLQLLAERQPVAFKAMRAGNAALLEALSQGTAGTGSLNWRDAILP